VIHLDQVDQAGVEHRADGVGQDDLLLGVPFRAPVVMFPATNQVAGLWEGRDPAVAVAHRVPADMVDVQVGADDGVDALAGPAGRLEGFQEIRGQGLAADKAARAIIPDAGVDHQSQAGCLNQEGVDGQAKVALWRHVVRR
jgi:hypothetical protein